VVACGVGGERPGSVTGGAASCATSEGCAPSRDSGGDELIVEAGEEPHAENLVEGQRKDSEAASKA
jgi:hypothetical protein